MSYELLYKRFLVKEHNGTLTPYIITGSNNCFELSGKRERSVYRFYDNYKKEPKDSLRDFLGKMYDIMSKENSGYSQGVPKTKNGFIEGFFKKIITRDEFIPYGVRMENYLDNKFKSSRTTKSDYDVGQCLIENALIKVNNENVRKYAGKTIIPFNRNNEPIIGKGKFKTVNLARTEYGFFKSHSKKRYTYLDNIDYFKVVR